MHSVNWYLIHNMFLTSFFLEYNPFSLVQWAYFPDFRAELVPFSAVQWAYFPDFRAELVPIFSVCAMFCCSLSILCCVKCILETERVVVFEWDLQCKQHCGLRTLQAEWQPWTPDTHTGHTQNLRPAGKAHKISWPLSQYKGRFSQVWGFPC